MLAQGGQGPRRVGLPGGRLVRRPGATEGVRALEGLLDDLERGLVPELIQAPDRGPIRGGRDVLPVGDRLEVARLEGLDAEAGLGPRLMCELVERLEDHRAVE